MARRSKLIRFIDWTVFEKELHKVCQRSIHDAAGRPAYSPLTLFELISEKSPPYSNKREAGQIMPKVSCSQSKKG